MQIKFNPTQVTLANSAMLVLAFVAQVLCATSGFAEQQEQVAGGGQELVKVQTTIGQLLGAKQNLNNIHGHSVYKFLGVPYAKAPIGELRFQKPVELEAAKENQLDARKHAHTCPQFRHLTRFISPLLDVDNEHQISEDCLHLNIYVPASIGNADESSLLVPNKQLPMLVWIPGEGFDFADARQFDGSYLAHKTQSVVVTVQYRVGVFGFLHAPQLNITGNMGLHDQLMALRWLQKNAHSFGADPERVTLMGRFSGAMSISALVTAPMNESLLKFKGQPLFQRAALLSGIAVDKWIIDSEQAKRVKELGEQAIERGLCTPFEVTSNRCLQILPTESLLQLSGYGWRLVVDNQLIGKVSPVDAIRSNKVAPQLEAVLLGETAVEGTLCLYRYMIEDGLTNYARLMDEGRMNEDHLYEMINYDSQVYFGRNISSAGSVSGTLEALLADVEEPREKYLNACSSYLVKSHLNKFKRNLISANYQSVNRMNVQKKTVDVYHYELKYKPSFSLAPDYIKHAAHGDDVPLIFGLIYQQPSRDIDQRDLLMTRKMMAYVGNFVHGYNPLLARQSSSPHSTRETNSETISMDENDSSNSDMAPVVVKRTWSTEDQLDVIDLSLTDLRHLNRFINYTTQKQSDESSNNNNQKLVLSTERTGKQNFHVFLTETPGQENDEPNNQLNLAVDLHATNQEAYSSRSERLVELHRRQMVSGGSGSHLEFSVPQRKLNSQLQQLPHPQMVGGINESTFITVLIFSTGVGILALFSVCLALCIVIFRYNQVLQAKQSPSNNGTRFSESSSSYNICEDSRGSSIEDRVQKKNGLSNVFAKLRNPNNHLGPAPTSVQCHSTDIISVSQAFKCPAHPQNSTSVHRDNIESDELQSNGLRAGN